MKRTKIKSIALMSLATLAFSAPLVPLVGETAIAEPVAGNAPWGNVPANPQGSHYATDSGFTSEETALLDKALKKNIVDIAPEQFNALKIFFSLPMEEVPGDEFSFLESTFHRAAVTADSGTVAPGAPGAGARATQVIHATAGHTTRVGKDFVIVYPNNVRAVVQSITGNDITVKGQTNVSLPAINAGDVFSIAGPTFADGQDYIGSVERMTTVERYNYVELLQRAARWGEIERLKWQNLGKTNFLEMDMAEKIKALRTDMFERFFNGTRGEYELSGGLPAKAMGGIYPLMVAGGSASASPTLGSLKTTTEKLLFQTNHMAEGGTRFAFGTDEMLNEYSKIYKQPGLIYTPNNDLADLSLSRIKIGTQNVVPVPCELFRSDSSLFPRAWERRILFIDMKMVKPVKMRGLPTFRIATTLPKTHVIGSNPGSREGFQDTIYQAHVSLMMNRVLGSFYLNVA